MRRRCRQCRCGCFLLLQLLIMLYDRDIREPLFDFLEERYGKIRIIEEKQMGKSRADIVMVLPDAVASIEIKSDADTYVRLKRQVRDYNRYYDTNLVVVGSTHASTLRITCLRGGES